ncbi:hypothetical protein NDU88_004220 [Pleurodeles waltl]|uniref:Uncharacterized protein n=1 Tax=Pleurodeles waltl TaxID=8319 RepID=A0AAV7T8Y9_PLEWA|nr:hypothetical protein NDU88_004220 [Pleurodeles waltl]
MATQRLGRPAGGKRLPVRVGAPFGHRIEERGKPGVVHLTSRDAAGYGVGGQDNCPGTGVLPSSSQGAGLNLEHFEEELLDYEEEEEEHEVAVQTGGTVEMPKVNKRAVQGDHQVGRRHQELIAGNLPRASAELCNKQNQQNSAATMAVNSEAMAEAPDCSASIVWGFRDHCRLSIGIFKKAAGKRTPGTDGERVL